MEKLVILDRDGVINYDSAAYIKAPAEWLPIPRSLEAIASLNHQGYRVALATNQSGIARGLYDIFTLEQIHTKMQNLLAQLGGKIDAIYYCPHAPQQNCNCRKPKPGLLLAIAQHFACSLTDVPFIGDSWRDVLAAQAAGCRPLLVQTGNYTQELATQAQQQQIPSFPDLAHAVAYLTSHSSPHG